MALIRSPEAAVKVVPSSKQKAKATKLEDANKAEEEVAVPKKVLPKVADESKAKESSPPVQGSAARDAAADLSKKFTALNLCRLLAGIVLAACVFSALAQPLPKLLGLCSQRALPGSMVRKVMTRIYRRSDLLGCIFCVRSVYFYNPRSTCSLRLVDELIACSLHHNSIFHI